MTDHRKDDANTLERLLLELRTGVAEEMDRHPERMTSARDIGLYFVGADGCDPCGEKVTTMSTCTKISTKTSSTTKRALSDAWISQDVLALEAECTAL